MQAVIWYLKNSRYRSQATKMLLNDSGLFPFQFGEFTRRLSHGMRQNKFCEAPYGGRQGILFAMARIN
jgi:hypothetical protein